MTSLTRKSLTCSALIVASLALTANAAMAANAGVQNVVWPDVDPSTVTAHAAGRYQPPTELFGFLFAGPGYRTSHERTSVATASPSYDSSPPIDYSAQQQAQQTIDSVNETEMLNSEQATQAANDAANAATAAGLAAAEQTEIYANSYTAQ
jgi:hypothetical protein